jgi:hypothetical protein
MEYGIWMKKPGRIGGMEWIRCAHEKDDMQAVGTHTV